MIPPSLSSFRSSLDACLVSLLLLVHLCSSGYAFTSTNIETSTTPGRLFSQSHFRRPDSSTTTILTSCHRIHSTSLTTTAAAAATYKRRNTSLSMSSDGSNSKRKGGLEEGLRNKLVTESIAPWRTLRLFLYGTLGIGAFVGGLINTSGAIAASKLNPAEFNLQAELTNIGIDFGAVAVMVALAKFDIDRQNELQSKVDEKIKKKKEMKQVLKAMKDREKVLRNLPLDITISQDGATQEAIVGELQTGAKQHMIIVAGPRKACKDALIGANLLKMDFAMRNVLVVPYEIEGETTDKLSRPTGSGFGDRPSYETQPYIARPVGDAWDDFIAEEMADAIRQGGENVKKEGIALVVANSGKVIRRGVGVVPWRQMVEELDQAVSPKQDGPLPWIAF